MRYLTANDILTAVRRTDGGRMSAAYLADRSAPATTFGRGVTESLPAQQQQWLNDMSQVRTNGAAPRYDHPGARPVRREPGPLTPAELVWIQRLPADPAQVSYEDARVLVGLVASVGKVATPGADQFEGAQPAHNDPKAAGDSRLVESIYAPIRELHDRAVANIRLEVAQQPLPAIPASTTGALAEAYMAEIPGLRQHEAWARAEEAVADARADREATRQKAIDAARKDIARVDEALAKRTATAPLTD